MEKVKILRSTIASGKQLEAGCVCDIPGDISGKDAKLLCQMGKAEEVKSPAGDDKPGRGKEKK